MIVIAVSGCPVSGKSTLAKELARIYGLRYVSIGMLFRKIAQERGVSLLELHKIAEQDHSIDVTIDNMCIEEARKGNVVLDGHLTGWILKDLADVKIYVKASLNERARRLAEREGKSFEEALSEIKMREELNRRRYLTIYNIDINDLSIFNLIIDNTDLDFTDTLTIAKTYIDAILRVKRR